uniref:Uncharacterized protein n=1 Tax=Noctiluca scintillans TaxID=2966 RepID=A0A7S1AJY8_NOCSC|mmetsp:Transcript_49475/g.131309  ORF Transcript_49475/g.131309 Transcript_49475/m.131309 type:complete len:239 (+) Transcript_49475:63-779(+)
MQFRASLLWGACAYLAGVNASFLAPDASTNTSTSTTRAKIDLGFDAFEAKLLADVSSGVAAATTATVWTSQMRESVTANVTQSLQQTMHEAFAPLKKSVAHTWMALPAEQQKTEYIQAVKASFARVFSQQLNMTTNRMASSFRAIAREVGLSRTADQLVANATVLISDGLLKEHCYGGDTKGVVGAAHQKERHFCMPSRVQTVVKQLNDSQELISMTARYDAGALSLLAKQKSKARAA